MAKDNIIYRLVFSLAFLGSVTLCKQEEIWEVTVFYWWKEGKEEKAREANPPLAAALVLGQVGFLLFFAFFSSFPY